MALYFDINHNNPEELPFYEDLKAVFQSVENILSTRLGERFFNPEFGVDLDDALFELIDDLTALDILSKITTAIQRFEPRVILDTSETTVTAYEDKNRYDVDLVFSVVGFDGQKFIYTDSIKNEQVEGAS